jgi:SAM-dependent methyltransferase
VRSSFLPTSAVVRWDQERGAAMTAKYTIDGGTAGMERLNVLARACAPGTKALLDRVGVPEGARCLDVGCGGGHVSRELATRAGQNGSVVAIDLDPTVLELAGAAVSAEGITNVEFRCCDATQFDRSTGDVAYDMAYARCLLSHVGDPARVVSAMAASLKPGGLVVVEDVDFTGHFCYPACQAHDRFVELYRETVRRRGGNADIGPTLPSLLKAAGLEDIGVKVWQECGLQGDAKLISPLTLTRIADAVVSEGVATAEEVTQSVADLSTYAADPTTLMSMPRFVQAWGSPSLGK